jgi:hypothetical protein
VKKITVEIIWVVILNLCETSRKSLREIAWSNWCWWLVCKWCIERKIHKEKQWRNSCPQNQFLYPFPPFPGFTLVQMFTGFTPLHITYENSRRINENSCSNTAWSFAILSIVSFAPSLHTFSSSLTLWSLNSTEINHQNCESESTV